MRFLVVTAGRSHFVCGPLYVSIYVRCGSVARAQATRSSESGAGEREGLRSSSPNSPRSWGALDVTYNFWAAR